MAMRVQSPARLPGDLLLLLLLLALPTLAQAQFAYLTNANDTITVSGFTGGDTAYIPSTINGLPVVSIGDSAFCGWSCLTSLWIPNSVTNIGRDAFAFCSGLPKVTIPDTVTSIGDSAFESCTNLTSVRIADGVGAIGRYAFSECTRLTGITIPGTVTNIGSYAFCYCGSLTSVYFQGNAPSPDDASVFAYANNPILYYLPGTTGWGTTFAGRPAVLWNPTIETTSADFGVISNQFGFNVTGTPNIPIVLEASPNLEFAGWDPLLIGTLTNGSIYFIDPDWTNFPARFYRIRSPYDNYLVEFAPAVGGVWSNFGVPFTPTTTTSTEDVNVNGNAGFFRVRHLP